jgi:hypothetical protein
MQWLSEIKFQDPRTLTYLGSPSLVRLPEGALLASHDYFGPGCPKNSNGEGCLTTIHRSDNNGESWRELTHICGAFWSSLFVHEGAVYLLGTSARYGAIVIRQSLDGGYTWTHPLDADSGLLFPNGPYPAPPHYHCAPTPVLQIGGRLYRAFEVNPSRRWPAGFQAIVISCADTADLLKAKSWTMSKPLAYEQEWLPNPKASNSGWLEGNIVAGPDGHIWNLLRMNGEHVVETAALVSVEDEGRKLSFSPSNFVHMPGGACKFTVRRDSVTRLYWAITNPNVDPIFPKQRNVLGVVVSPDLRNWHYVCTLMQDDTGLTPEQSAAQTGFQYVDWQFDGDDIIYVVRVAYRGAHNYHDANRIVFARIHNFRSLWIRPVCASPGPSTS